MQADTACGSHRPGLGTYLPEPTHDSVGAGLAQPNPENKLFVGGAPPGTEEETLRKIFCEHGEVEEVHGRPPALLL